MTIKPLSSLKPGRLSESGARPPCLLVLCCQSIRQLLDIAVNLEANNTESEIRCAMSSGSLEEGIRESIKGMEPQLLHGSC